MAGTNSLEIEIHTLFQEGNSVDFVCQELISKYEKNEALSSLETEGIGHFLITCGRFDLLQSFLLKCVKRSKIGQFPLGIAAEAMDRQNMNISQNDIKTFEYVISQQPFEPTTLQSKIIPTFSVDIQKNIQSLPTKYNQERQNQKNRLIEQLNQHRIYQLHDQEETTLNLLMKLFPNDLEVGLLKQAHLERKADDILSRIISQKNLAKPKNVMTPHPETQKFIQEFELQLDQVIEKIKAESPDQLYNLAILTYQFDLFEKTLKILELCPETEARDWLMAETFLECHRYLDLLKLVEKIENHHSTNSESTYGSIYLKALAYYGLGQKDSAIRLLESLANAVSGYRSTEALLQEWKNG